MGSCAMTFSHFVALNTHTGESGMFLVAISAFSTRIELWYSARGGPSMKQVCRHAS